MPQRKAKPSTRNHKATKQTTTSTSHPGHFATGRTAHTHDGTSLVTHSIGALPILQRLLQRMRLNDFLQQHLPPEDARTKVAASQVILLLLNNLLVSREPVYGVAEWAREFDPGLFDLQPEQIKQLNDDRVGRCLERVFRALNTNLIMDVVTHVVREFDISLDELHNDSTTVSFCGEYPEADTEKIRSGQLTPAITWGHSKDHRPDLKQLLYILTVKLPGTNDGDVPIYFQAASGNVVDDQTHQATWKLMAQLTGRKDFVYVADCKLATTEQMRDIASRGRPSEKTKYVRAVQTRFTISWEVDGERMAREAAGDGVFPLLTNLTEWTARDVLDAYKRQPIIEKRFSQLKTDFRVAPVYLQNVEWSRSCSA